MLSISFIPTVSGNYGNYDLMVDGKSIVLDIAPEEVLESITGLGKQIEPIQNLGLFLRAIDKVNLKAPDPNIPLGVSQLLFIEGEVPKGGWGTELRVYERNTKDTSFLMFALYFMAPPLPSDPDTPQEQCAWGFYINREKKEVGKLIGFNVDGPQGETRARILEALIMRLGRDIKIMI